jgi:hypothetical protein
MLAPVLAVVKRGLPAQRARPLFCADVHNHSNIAQTAGMIVVAIEVAPLILTSSMLRASYTASVIDRKYFKSSSAMWGSLWKPDSYRFN